MPTANYGVHCANLVYNEGLILEPQHDRRCNLYEIVGYPSEPVVLELDLVQEALMASAVVDCELSQLSVTVED